MIRLICRAIIRELTWQPRRRYKPVQTNNRGNTDKRKALGESEVGQLIEGFPKCKVMHVIDGDTVIVARGWNQMMSGWIPSIAQKTASIGETSPHTAL